MAIPFILHRHVSKKEQKQPYTAAAHVRYISRQSATVYRYAERMPLQWHAAQRFLNEREDRIRKDGRVIDKLTIALPREMNMDQAVDTVRKFGFHLSQGRAPFYFTIQNWGQENPHCHFIFVDADVESGRRVFKTTDWGSTDRIKDLWEDVCNDELRSLGIDARISFSEAAELKAAKMEAERYEEEQSPIPDSEVPLDAPLNEFGAPDEEPIPAVEESAAEDALEGDEDMADDLTVPERVARIESVRIEAVRLQHLMGQREVLWEQFSQARKGVEKANLAVADAIVAKQFTDQNVYQAKLALQHYQRDDGKLKGWRVPILGWKTRTRHQAEEAERQFKAAEFRHAIKEHAYNSAVDHQTAQELRAFELERKATQLEIQLRCLGTDEELNEAMKQFDEQLAKDIWALQTNELEEAYARGEISRAQYREILHLSGRDQDLADLDAGQELQ
ncbi:MobA/MobL family protein [Bradyrhizobium manausense]|uniref:MobA/MobL family protein n=1 Tax=Bradyrhizobium manausense TaxID=989370 RepID=UPI001BAC40A0|nr:MobA/MobL family protein [Bradyrhizobium manausense]MBR0721753.1 hypothetical protein [Bradyrhizobium manausense]